MSTNVVNGVTVLNKPKDRMILVLRGAYGRAPTLDDWRSGKDFFLQTFLVRGSYCSIRDCAKLAELGFTHISLVNKLGKQVHAELLDIQNEVAYTRAHHVLR